MQRIQGNIKTLATVGLLFFVAACSGREVSAPEAVSVKVDSTSFSAGRIKADIEFLADDLLKGRDTGSDGYRIAAKYVAAEFARLGLRPAGGDDTFFQEVPFQSATLDQAVSALSVSVGGETTTYTLGDDFYMNGSIRTPHGHASADVVFAGYGVHAPEFGYDDLEGLDLEGKVALVLSGAPKTFQAEVRAHHGSTFTKAKVLAEHGARAIVTVNTRANEKRRPFKRMKNRLNRTAFDWVVGEGQSLPWNMEIYANVSNDVARTLFETSETTFDQVLADEEAGNVTPRALNSSMTLTRKSVLSDTIYSPNVLAVLPGSDPVLKDEFVVISAHLDHLGVSPNKDGSDNIHNGALDNAAGIAVMMEVARVFANSGLQPRRSLLFAAVTAEEKGLLGAEYFMNFPTVPIDAMVANVNLDMPILLYDFSDLVAFGAERSSLGPVTKRALKQIDIKLSPDPMPEEGIFTRSDHYEFVKKGIPAVFLVTGFGKGMDGKDGEAFFRGFLKHTYHGVKDDINQPINYKAGAKFAHANWLILSAIANGEKKPSWNKGDFFGTTFGR